MPELTKISWLLRAAAGLPPGHYWLDGEILFGALTLGRNPGGRRAEGVTRWIDFPPLWMENDGRLLMLRN